MMANYTGGSSAGTCYKELVDYTITYNSGKGTGPVPRKVAGHTFAGWVLQGTNLKWNTENSMPAKNITLVARYDKKHS